MELLELYNSYKNTHKDYVSCINDLFEEDFEVIKTDKVEMNLKKFKEEFEEIMYRCNKMEVEQENVDNLNDLKYLVLDSIFLSNDLYGYFVGGHKERFKMRISNYLNKLRREELLKGENRRSCPVDKF